MSDDVPQNFNHLNVYRDGKVLYVQIDNPPINLITVPLLFDFINLTKWVEDDAADMPVRAALRGAAPHHTRPRKSGKAQHSAVCRRSSQQCTKCSGVRWAAVYSFCVL